MKYDIRKNWLETLYLMMTKPVVIMPFVIIAFFECVVLELVYFSTRKPIAYIADPLVRKFLGEGYLHYPGNLVILPKLFYYGQVAIYVLIGVFLTAISVNAYKNITADLPIRAKALTKNAFGRYFSFFGYALLVTVLFFLLRNAESYIFSKIFNKIAKLLPFSVSSIYKTLTIIMIFVTNVVFQVFFISTVPLIVMEKMKFFKALIKSIYLGARAFFTIFILIALPFLIYFPIVFLKSFSAEIIVKTFPEMNLFISLVGIIISVFLDCFSLMCVSRFLLDWQNTEKAKKA